MAEVPQCLLGLVDEEEYTAEVKATSAEKKEAIQNVKKFLENL